MYKTKGLRWGYMLPYVSQVLNGREVCTTGKRYLTPTETHSGFSIKVVVVVSEPINNSRNESLGTPTLY